MNMDYPMTEYYDGLIPIMEEDAKAMKLTDELKPDNIPVSIVEYLLNGDADMEDDDVKKLRDEFELIKYQPRKLVDFIKKVDIEYHYGTVVETLLYVRLHSLNKLLDWMPIWYHSDFRSNDVDFDEALFKFTKLTKDDIKLIQSTCENDDLHEWNDFDDELSVRLMGILKNFIKYPIGDIIDGEFVLYGFDKTKKAIENEYEPLLHILDNYPRKVRLAEMEKKHKAYMAKEEERRRIRDEALEEKRREAERPISVAEHEAILNEALDDLYRKIMKRMNDRIGSICFSGGLHGTGGKSKYVAPDDIQEWRNSQYKPFPLKGEKDV